MPASGREPSPTIGPAQSLERPNNSFVASATETWSRELVLLGRMSTSAANFTIVRLQVVMLGEPLTTILAYILFPPSLKVAELFFLRLSPVVGK